MAGIDFIQMDWVSSTDWYGLSLMLAQFAIAIIILWLLIHYLIVRPVKFKYHINIYDITGSGVIFYTDRGAYISNKDDKTGEFRLMRDKIARLIQPPRSTAMPNKKGKTTYTFLKYGDGAFDYAAIDNSYLVKDLSALPNVIPLADQDWAKLSIKKAAEKRTLGNWWAENKGTVLFITAMVLGLVIVMGSVKMAQETAEKTIGASADQAQKFNDIAEALNNVANKLSGDSIQPIPPPPKPS